MNTELDQKNWWDDASSAEFEKFLDDIDKVDGQMEEAERLYEERQQMKLEEMEPFK